MRLISWVTRKKWLCDENRFPFFVLPLQVDCQSQTSLETLADLNWNEIEEGASNEVVALQDTNLLDDPDNRLSDRMLLQRQDERVTSSVAYRSVCQDLDIESIGPEYTREGKKQMSFFDYHRDVICKNAPNKPEMPADKRMLEVSPLERMENLLIMSSKKQGHSRKAPRVFLIAAYAWLHPLRVSTARSATLVPTLLARIDQAMIAHECNQLIFNNRLDHDVVMIALAAPSANHAFDYQRFEFLGDTCLKFLASCQVFAASAEDNEGSMHLARRSIISNTRLIRHSKAIELWRYIVGDSFTGRSYKPSNFREVEPVAPQLRSVQLNREHQKLVAAREELTKSNDDKTEELQEIERQLGVLKDQIERQDKLLESLKTAAEADSGPADDAPQDDAEKAREKLHIILPQADTRGPFRPNALSEKALADVIESLMGAACACTGLQGALEASVTLAVMPTAARKMSDFADMHLAQVRGIIEENKWDSRVSSGALASLEKHLHYKFKNPYLALMALTHSSRLNSFLPSYEVRESVGEITQAAAYLFDSAATRVPW